MRAVIQRVSKAAVLAEGVVSGSIGAGLFVLLGVLEGDTQRQADFLAKKLVELRVFEDENGKMNRSLLDTGGAALIVSQFTLAADCTHGRRPSFIAAAKPEQANVLYERFVSAVRERLPCADGAQRRVATGVFGADMEVSIVGDGPVTILFDTEKMKLSFQNE